MLDGLFLPEPSICLVDVSLPPPRMGPLKNNCVNTSVGGNILKRLILLSHAVNLTSMLLSDIILSFSPIQST